MEIGLVIQGLGTLATVIIAILTWRQSNQNARQLKETKESRALAVMPRLVLTIDFEPEEKPRGIYDDPDDFLRTDVGVELPHDPSSNLQADQYLRLTNHGRGTAHDIRFVRFNNTPIERDFCISALDIGASRQIIFSIVAGRERVPHSSELVVSYQNIYGEILEQTFILSIDQDTFVHVPRADSSKPPRVKYLLPG